MCLTMVAITNISSDIPSMSARNGCPAGRFHNRALLVMKKRVT